MNSGAIKMLPVQSKRIPVPLGFAACYQRDARTKTHSGATKTDTANYLIFNLGATKKSLTRATRVRAYAIEKQNEDNHPHK